MACLVIDLRDAIKSRGADVKWTENTVSFSGPSKQGDVSATRPTVCNGSICYTAGLDSNLKESVALAFKATYVRANQLPKTPNELKPGLDLCPGADRHTAIVQPVVYRVRTIPLDEIENYPCIHSMLSENHYGVRAQAGIVCCIQDRTR